MAGILNSKGSYCVIIDVDLQDPPEVIEQLYKKIVSYILLVKSIMTNELGLLFAIMIIHLIPENSIIFNLLILKISYIEIFFSDEILKFLSKRILSKSCILLFFLDFLERFLVADFFALTFFFVLIFFTSIFKRLTPLPPTSIILV